MKLLEIKDAEYLGEYRIQLEFNDGKITVIDFEPFFEAREKPNDTKQFGSSEISAIFC